jgi:predicted RNase H-like nuclease (RuvC/YqgF family)
MRQLPLFSADAEATRRLHEAYDLLRADYEALSARLERAKAEFRTLRQERDQLRQERDTLEESNLRLYRALEEARWQCGLALQSKVPAPRLEPTLKKLLTLAHPDKWSRGQPATALAHELTVTINTLRAQGEGRR